jgi:hypothetical protein
LINKPTKQKGTCEGDRIFGKGGKIKEIKLGAQGKILTVDEKTKRDINKSVTKTV